MKSGVSLITCCMNRPDLLLNSLRTWLKLSEVKEIIIVNWSSYNFSWNSIKNLNSENKIKFVDVIGEKYWILTHAYNLAFKFVNYDKILKVDCDIKLHPNFFENHVLYDKTFYRGNWETTNENQVHINGQFFCNYQDFKNVNGFNEKILTYGYDDEDLYKRFCNNNIQEKNINNNFIEHQDHVRGKNNDIPCIYNNKIEIALNLFDSYEKKMIERNKIFCRKADWNTKNELTMWDIKEKSINSYICFRKSNFNDTMDYTKCNIALSDKQISKFVSNLKKWEFAQKNCLNLDSFDEVSFKQDFKIRLNYIN